MSQDIFSVARSLHIADSHVSGYGTDKAKISLQALEDRPQRKREYRPETLPQLQVYIIPVETRPVVPDPLLRILVIDAFIPVTKEICRIARSLHIRME